MEPALAQEPPAPVVPAQVTPEVPAQPLVARPEQVPLVRAAQQLEPAVLVAASPARQPEPEPDHDAARRA